MKKQHLSNKDIKKLNQELEERYGLEQFIGKKEKVELLEHEDYKVILIDDTPGFFYLDNKLVPTLKLLLKQSLLKTVVVDMPAVPFMVKGADVMRPGITAMDDFAKDELIVVVDENNKKPLCIGKALYSSQDMKTMDKGKVIKNIHFVGDKLWKLV